MQYSHIICVTRSRHFIILASLFAGLITCVGASASHGSQSSLNRPQLTDNLYPASSTQKTPTTHPLADNLYILLAAEFMLDRGEISNATSLYEQQAILSQSSPIYERALSLAMDDHLDGSSERALYLTNLWSSQNPAHVPAWFYQAHFAIKSGQYDLAASTLNKIIQYDPDADLEAILAGITPEEPEEQAKLLAAIKDISSDNPALLVLKAGILQQHGRHKEALALVDLALEQRPRSTPTIILKARILNSLDQDKSQQFIKAQIDQHKNNKSLYLYEIRTLLKQKQSKKAHQFLVDAVKRFKNDNEIKLLASLVAIDVGEFRQADKLLTELEKDFSYADQARYYLGISAERQENFVQAANYFVLVQQDDLVFDAQRKLALLRIKEGGLDTAVVGLQNFAEARPDFISESYRLQAKLLEQAGQPKQALTALERGISLSNDPRLAFARIKLLPRSAFIEKTKALEALVVNEPNNTDYMLYLAQHYIESQANLARVKELAHKLAESRPDSPDVKALQGQIYLLEGRQSEATKALLEAYQIRPSITVGQTLVKVFNQLGEAQAAAKIRDDLMARFGQSSLESTKTPNMSYSDSSF